MTYQDLNEGQLTELTSQYDARASFYGKAHVQRNGTRLVLLSYATPVMYAETNQDNGLTYYRMDESQPESQTTSRHMREFILQTGGQRLTAQQLRKIPTR